MTMALTPDTTRATALAELKPPALKVPNADTSPVKNIKSSELQQLGQHLDRLFLQYVSDRRIAELRWLRNQRQYLGIYDPEVEKELNANRSKAYPRITRVKCISVLSRLMNLMFPGNDRNWELKAAPDPDITLDEVKQAIAEAQKKDTDAGVQPEMSLEYVQNAITEFMNARVEKMSELIDDQLQELGGDQTYDYVALNRKVIQSGVLYGLGVMRGPYAVPKKSVTWSVGDDGIPVPKSSTVYKPMFEFIPVWDFYPDMSAKTFQSMDGFFTRVVMSRAQVRKLIDREDFFESQIRTFLQRNPQGNYRPQAYEQDLRAMGVKVNVNEMKAETMKYEVIVWHGAVSGEYLRMAGCEVAPDKLADDLDAEVWLLGGNVIKAAINPWRSLGMDVKTIHTFLFDEDDTSPIGFGLPNAIRDSQMAISAATRMLMDNASVVCGPNLEMNTDLLRPDQDLQAISAYKVWYREGTGADAQFPAVRNVEINSHLNDLMKIIELFMKFADTETFVGPATGGDMAQAPSEPMRTAAGASMVRGDAALPFKDIVRSFDQFTQSVIESMVQFNKLLNPAQAPEGDYDVIARGATSLIAKEIKGAQADQLAATLKPEEMIHIDERKLVMARIKARDMEDILVTEEEAQRRQQQQDDQAQKQQDMQTQQAEATIRKLLSDAFKNISAAQKNTATADAATVSAALDLLERGLNNAAQITQAGGGPSAGTQPDAGNSGDDALSGAAGPAPVGGQG
jgi:hypothetical protein